MKTKLIKIAMLLGMITGLASCKKYLDTEPVGQFLVSNFYSNPSQAYSGVIACYSPLTSNYYLTLMSLNSGSDDAFAGGGNSGDYSSIQAFSNYSLLTAASGTGELFWGYNYNGIYNCNSILQALPTVPGLSTELLNRYTGEAKFLRAFYYFDLVRLFRNIPFTTAPLTTAEVFEQLQATPETVYAQIESDLKDAISKLPVTIPTNQNGRVTQGAARALLGKVLLTTKKYTEAAEQLALVNGILGGTNVYGYRLLADYGQVFSSKTKYSSESIFELQQTNTVNNFSNGFTQFTGPRGSSVPIYFSGGYGFNVVTLQLVNAIKNDPRYPHTVINIDSLAKATNTSYQPSYQNTGYFTRKYAGLASEQTNFGWNGDILLIRLADTYLMEAEALVQSGTGLARAESLLNAVRARVKLAPVSATINNIYTERQLELAEEGHRWFDLVRTGRAPAVLAFKNFKAGINEILPIPLSDLNNSKLKQNPGY